MVRLLAVPRLSAPPRLVLTATTLLALLSLPSCDCGRESGDPPVTYAGGVTELNHYESSGLYETWLHFPAGRRYRLLHDLPAAPDLVLVYLAFREDPLREDEPGNITASSGNAALVEAVREDHVQIRNDTCSEYYVRVVAEVTSSSAPAAAGAGGSGS